MEFFFIVGDVNVETEIQIGKKSDQDDKNIRISIERNIDKNGQEIINVSATGRGSVTKEDIEQELEKLFAEKNIDATSGILPSLINLGLGNNQLTGEIPESICDLNVNWSSDSYFYITNNQLYPPYPSCIEDYVEKQDTSDRP